MSTMSPNPINDVISKILSSLPLSGYKTYLSAAGLVIVALYQAFVTHDYVAAFQSLMGALGAIGLRHAIAKGA